MRAYIDESGDPGLKIGQGSSAFFVIAVILFDDQKEEDVVDKRLSLLRHELGLKPFFEFKFNKASHNIRSSFLKAVAPYNFFYYGIVINKKELYGEGFKQKESFYKYVMQLVLLNAREHLEETGIYIDSSGNRDFRRQFNNYLKLKINQGKRHVRKVDFLDSKKSNHIQLADMVAGAIHRSFSEKKDAEDYIRIIRHREASLQIWPAIKKPKP